MSGSAVPVATGISLPELDALIVQERARAWTDEIDAMIRRYYPELAPLRRVRALTEAINHQFGRAFTNGDIQRRARALLAAGGRP
jgi:hypothetical protein